MHPGACVQSSGVRLRTLPHPFQAAAAPRRGHAHVCAMSLSDFQPDSVDLDRHPPRLGWIVRKRHATSFVARFASCGWRCTAAVDAIGGQIFHLENRKPDVSSANAERRGLLQFTEGTAGFSGGLAAVVSMETRGFHAGGWHTIETPSAQGRVIAPFDRNASRLVLACRGVDSALVQVARSRLSVTLPATAAGSGRAASPGP